MKMEHHGVCGTFKVMNMIKKESHYHCFWIL